MKKTHLKLIVIIFSTQIAGCFPMWKILPMESTVIDAETNQPIQNALVVRSVCDIHSTCENPHFDIGKTDKNGQIKFPGDRVWFYIPIIGGIPIPNHEIVIWQNEFYAFYWSQYDNKYENFVNTAKYNKEVASLIMPIQKPPKYLQYDEPNKMFKNGIIYLYRISE